MTDQSEQRDQRIGRRNWVLIGVLTLCAVLVMALSLSTVGGIDKPHSEEFNRPLEGNGAGIVDHEVADSDESATVERAGIIDAADFRIVDNDGVIIDDENIRETP